MKPVRVLGGIFLFTASLWLIPMIPVMMSDVESFVVGMFSALIAFVGGMFVYSGVKECPLL